MSHPGWLILHNIRFLNFKKWVFISEIIQNDGPKGNFFFCTVLYEKFEFQKFQSPEAEFEKNIK